MKLKTLKRAPVMIAGGVIIFVCFVQVIRPDFLERVEWMTYDLRMKVAVKHSPEVAPNLGFVSIGDETIVDINHGLAGSQFGLQWPRQLYGRVAAELAAQGAKAVAFDILMAELRRDHAPVLLQGLQTIESDDFFAARIKEAGNVIIAAEQGTIPPLLFRTNALALGDITTDRDSDGVLRRDRAFRTYRKWHQAFRQVESDPDYGVDLRKGRVEGGQVVLPRSDGEPIRIPLDTNGNFDLADFVGDRIPAGMARFDKPFTEERVWHMGIVLAAQELRLDLTNAEVDLEQGRIMLRGPQGLTRTLPVDQQGYFYINWCLAAQDRRLTWEPFEGLLAQYQIHHGLTNRLAELRAGYWQSRNLDWKGKLVVVGSRATGSDLTDRGATPLENDTFLVSKHWNVANSLLTGQFIRRSPLGVELLLIALMGGVAAWLTWAFRSRVGSIWVLVSLAGYVVAAFFVFVQYRYWMPIVLPVGGGLMVTHAVLLAYVVVFEQKERRRMRSVFTKMVPADVVAELEKSDTEKLSLSGARRNVTVLFADIRGFTEMTDINREKAAEFVRERNLVGEPAEATFDAQARQALDTVNDYLKVMAEVVLKHKGALDKFIGDCVMAFWGAPLPNEKHALACVRAAIDVQRSVYRLNQEREVENKRREAENLKLAAAGQPALPLLPILVVGSGINTGVVTAGYMGSDERLNYTVFGRDVNLASRLETVSGRGRIIISEATLAEIIQDDPTLALSCVQLPPVKVKGIRDAVPIYEVPWREAGAGETPAAYTPVATASEFDTTHLTGAGPG